MLTGARQTGKTTLTQSIEPARAYFTLDDVGVLDQAERNPDSLLATHSVLLDEVQRAPQILLAVKRAVDSRRRAGDFILTGSANLLRMKQAIFQTLETWCALDPQRRKLHYWRNRAGHEVDFILEEAGKLVALEIKASSQVTSSDAIGIRAFQDDLKRKASFVRGVVLHGDKVRPLDADVVALPWWGWMVQKSRTD